MASEFDPVEVSALLTDARQAAAAQAAGSVEDSPDDAARAIQLGQATGIHPLAIVGDDTFEPRHKAQLAAQIINNNDALQRYVNSHPLAARVSNDDWGGLDQASRSISAVGEKGIFGRFIDEFKEGFGDPQLGQWMYEHEPTRKMLEKYPGLALWVAGVGGLIELPAKIFTGTLHGAHGAIEQGLMDAGMESSSARKLAKDLTGMLEYKFMKPEAPSPGPSAVKRTYAPLKAEIEKLAKDNEAARPFLEAQEEPPYGLTKDVDSLKEGQLKLDEKAIADAVKDFQATSTFARSPEMASIFAGVHPETKLEVSAQAIRKLYGEKEPTAGDGLFGDIPGFIEKLHSAEQLNGGVEISLKDWLHLDPEVIKELKEDIRHRDGGVSRLEVEEAKEAAKLAPEEEEGIIAFQGSPHEFSTFGLPGGAHVGTGEGTAAFGHPLEGGYLAEEPKVAEGYARPGYRQPGLSDIQYRAMDVLNENKGDRAKAITQLENTLKHLGEIKEEPAHGFPLLSPNEVEGALKLLKEGYEPPTGQHYKVRIRAKKEEFLDWDKPFEEQHPKVQAALEKLTGKYEPTEQDPFNRGQDFYEEIVGVLTEEGMPRRTAEKEASQRLKDAGIPGIKYLDQGSRAAKDVGIAASDDPRLTSPTHNLVVFDPSLITILSRNGQALASVEKAAGLESKVMKEMGREEPKAEEAKPTESKPTHEVTVEKKDDLGYWIRSNVDPEDKLTLMTKPDGLYVSGAAITPTARGKGLGTALYKRAIELAQELGLPFRSDTSVSPDAVRVYESLKKQGYKVTENPEYKADATIGEIKDKQAWRFQVEAPETAEPSPFTEPIFGKGALGLPKTQVALLQKLIDQKNSENMERELKRAVKAEARKQTAEWKDNRKAMAAEVEEEFYRKPEVAATQWLFDNKLGKAKTGKHTLDETKVTPEQRAALPDRMFAKSGKKLSPDELASQVGSLSGKELLEDLTSLHEAIGDTPWRQAFREAISAETDNRMQKKYGDLASNILEEAKDHALGITQMDLLHEDTVAMGMLAEAEMPYTKGEVRAWIKGFARDQLLGSLKADKFLQDSGRLGKLIEIALAKKKFAEAFKAAQTREYNALMAKEAKRIEKERDWYEGQAKRWRKEVKPEDPISGEAGDMIHALLVKTGFAVDRSIQQIQESMIGHGWNNLREFIESKQADGEVAGFPNWIYDSEPKAIKDLTYEQFKQVHDGLKGLLAYGKRAKKIFIGEKEIDRLNARDEMLEVQSGFKTKSYREAAPKGWERVKQKVKELGLLPVQPEFFFDRLDSGEKWGPHTQYMIRDLIDSFNNTGTKWREFGRKFDELSERLGIKGDDWNELIPNNLIRNPYTGETLKITRSELRTIILNMGNPENFKKLHEGWKVDPLALKAWVKDHSTAKDWDWAHGVGKIFEDAGRESQRMWRRLYGTAWDFIDLPPVQTPFGEKPGWYVPLIRDSYFEKEFNSANKIYANNKGLFEYIHDRIATPDGHTKDRTQAVYPLNLDVRMIPGRLRTMIYDTEMREAVLNFRSFSQDAEWRASVRSKFGKHYTDMLDAYIKDVANYPIDNAAQIAGVNSVMGSLLRNIVTSLIAFNPGTVLKHGPTAAALSARTVGAQEFASAYRQVWLSSARSDIRKIIWEKSEEIQRRTRNYEESLFGSYIESTLGEGKFSKTQRKFQEYGAAAVAFSDRLSSEPTWWAEYNKVLNEGRDEGSAVYAANRAVRFAHGSTAITSRPAAMRGGPMSKMFTILYGFFNDMFNRSYRMAWQAKDTVTDAHDLFKAGEAKEGWTTVSKGGRRFLGDLVVLGLFVGLVEEVVSPITGQKEDPEEGLGTILTKGTIHGLTSQVPILREVVDGLLRGQVPQVGALGSAYRAGHDVYRDLSKFGERDLDDHLLHLGDYAQHATTALGVATGIGSRPVGNAAKYWINVAQGLEEAPEGPFGAATGTRFGISKKHSRTLDEYTSHWLEKAGMQ